jgi:flagellar biogenesis protein FliO
VDSLAKLFVFLGLLFLLVGLSIWGLNKLGMNPFAWFGSLPLDFQLDYPNIKFYFPLGSMIVVSLLLSLAVYLFSKFRELFM